MRDKAFLIMVVMICLTAPLFAADDPNLWAPVIDPGPNWLTWLNPESNTVQLDATVTDPDDNLVSILWEVYRQPRNLDPNIVPIVFSDETIEDPLATVYAEGTFMLRIKAEDAMGAESEALMEIQVFSNACSAAKKHPDGYTPIVTDFNSDCQVNLDDMALLVGQWMNTNYLTENITYDPGIVLVPGIRNGGFETGDTSEWYNAEGVVGTSSVHGGTYSYFMNDSQGLFQDIYLEAGSYTLTFWYKGNMPTLYYGDENGNLPNTELTPSSSYQQESVTFSMDADGEMVLWLWGGNTSSSSGCYVDDFVITKI